MLTSVAQVEHDVALANLNKISRLRLTLVHFGLMRLSRLTRGSFNQGVRSTYILELQIGLNFVPATRV